MILWSILIFNFNYNHRLLATKIYSDKINLILSQIQMINSRPIFRVGTNSDQQINDASKSMQAGQFLQITNKVKQISAELASIKGQISCLGKKSKIVYNLQEEKNILQETFKTFKNEIVYSFLPTLHIISINYNQNVPYTLKRVDNEIDEFRGEARRQNRFIHLQNQEMKDFFEQQMRQMKGVMQDLNTKIQNENQKRFKAIQQQTKQCINSKEETKQIMPKEKIELHKIIDDCVSDMNQKFRDEKKELSKAVEYLDQQKTFEANYSSNVPQTASIADPLYNVLQSKIPSSINFYYPHERIYPASYKDRYHRR